MNKIFMKMTLSLMFGAPSVAFCGGTVGNGTGGPEFEAGICKAKFVCIKANASHSVNICEDEKTAQVLVGTIRAGGAPIIRIAQNFEISQISANNYSGKNFLLAIEEDVTEGGWQKTSAEILLDDSNRIDGLVYCQGYKRRK